MSDPMYKPRRCSFKTKPAVMKRHKHSEEEKLGWVEKAGFSLLPQEVSTPKPKIHIRMANYTYDARRQISKCEYRWYQIPCVDLEINREFMNGPLPQALGGDMPHNVPICNSTAVALFPRIYVLGGGTSRDDPPNTNVVYSYDTTSPEKGWERCPDMRYGRSRPSAVAIDGKVYVFGGMVERYYYTSETEIKPYAEVYDPELDTWEALSKGDDGNGGFMDACVCRGHGHHALFVDQHQKKHVLVPTFHSRSLFTYAISANSFTLRKSLSDDSAAGYAAAVVDGILYYYTPRPGRINGYDLRKCQWFPEPVQGLCNGTVLPFGDSLSLSLLNIGDGRLCIIYGCELPREAGKVCVRCSVATVRKRWTPATFPLCHRPDFQHLHRSRRHV